MTRIFDALKKAESAPKAPEPAHGVPAPLARPEQASRGSVPLLGALPLGDDVQREMSALRVTLESVLTERMPRTVIFLGSQGGEGTSTVALQFAQVLARDVAARPLLIDCHAQRPAFAYDESSRRAIALPAVLENPGEGGAVVTANLFVVPVSETHRAAGLIQPAALRQIIDVNSPGFDWVILDGPPILEAPDAAALGAVADGAVLVIEAGRTKRPVVTRAAELLSKSGARTLGTILNRRVHEIPEFIYRRI